MSAFWAMTWNGFREARRNRVTTVVGAFALVSMLSTNMVTEVTVMTFDRVLNDFGLGMMAVLLVALSIYLSCGMLAQEIERRTIFLIVSRPISRARFLLARLAGNMLTLAILMVAMAVIFFAELKFFGTDITQPTLMAMAGLLVELLLLSAAGFFFSSISGQLVAAICTTSVYFAGHLSPDMVRITQNSKNEVSRLFGTVLYYVVPNLERVNFRPNAAYAAPVDYALFLNSVLYTSAYALGFIGLAIFFFERRDFK